MTATALNAVLNAALTEAKARGVAQPESHVGAWQEALEATDTLGEVRWAELLLVAACAAGEPSAVAAFDSDFIVPAARAVAAQHRVDERELAQLVRTRLLVGDGVSRLRGWRGRAPLEAWVRAVTVRLALGLLPARTTDERWDDALKRLTHAATPELLMLEQTQRREVQAALADALRRLPRREKVVLRLHVFQSLSTEQLGRVFHVAPSTVRRWIQGARAIVLETVRTTLSRTASWSSSEIDSALARVSTLELRQSALSS